MTEYKKTCSNCGSSYVALKAHGKFCGNRCRKEHFDNQKMKELLQSMLQFFLKSGMSLRGIKQAINEMEMKDGSNN